MTDDQDHPNAASEVTASQNYNKRIAQELAEAEADKRQLALDRWWESQRDLEFEEGDIYEVGGYIEYHSKTPSFHKSKRDRDWGCGDQAS
jgi:hypothetical protein